MRPADLVLLAGRARPVALGRAVRTRAEPVAAIPLSQPLCAGVRLRRLTQGAADVRAPVIGDAAAARIGARPGDW